jgi:hypothetical protein
MINPWTQGRVPGVGLYPPLGAWLNRRKMASAAWVPPQWARLGLAGSHAYWNQFPELVLNPAQTQLTRITVNEDFWLITVLARSTSALAGGSGTFRALIYEDTGAYKYSKYAVNQPNIAAFATEPGLCRMPHFIAAGTPVNCRVQNLDGANPNTVDLALFGYSAWWRN